MVANHNTFCIDPVATSIDPSPSVIPIDCERVEVVIFDGHERSRVNGIAEYVETSGADILWVDDDSSARRLEPSPRSNIAFVALGEKPLWGAPVLDLINTLTKKGFHVVSYEDGVDSWPLSVRSRILLAGASHLLDSGNSKFDVQMSDLLAKLLQVSRDNRLQNAEMRLTMEEIGIVGGSEEMMSAFRWVQSAAPLSDIPVLISGETGTGKELQARALYHLDPKRSKGPFVALNCGAISPSLAESELFGHQRGAFTGADIDREGLFRRAEGGVLFLDEIGELELGLQTKLLRVLQEGRLRGVGDDDEVEFDVRIIAATNRDLAKLVEQGKFRADLFHRLNVLSVRLPSLRERPTDLNLLIEHFVEKHLTLAPSPTISVGCDFQQALAQANLPGNVRQLENLIRRALACKADDSPLDLTDLPPEILQQLAAVEEDSAPKFDPADHQPLAAAEESIDCREQMRAFFAGCLKSGDWTLSRSLDYCEKALLMAALELAGGKQTRAATMLGITPRSVYNKIHKHELEAPS